MLEEGLAQNVTCRELHRGSSYNYTEYHGVKNNICNLSISFGSRRLLSGLCEHLHMRIGSVLGTQSTSSVESKVPKGSRFILRVTDSCSVTVCSRPPVFRRLHLLCFFSVRSFVEGQRLNCAYILAHLRMLPKTQLQLERGCRLTCAFNKRGGSLAPISHPQVSRDFWLGGQWCGYHNYTH